MKHLVCLSRLPHSLLVDKSNTTWTTQSALNFMSLWIFCPLHTGELLHPVYVLFVLPYGNAHRVHSRISLPVLPPLVTLVAPVWNPLLSNTLCTMASGYFTHYILDIYYFFILALYFCYSKEWRNINHNCWMISPPSSAFIFTSNCKHWCTLI
jgi:hypothetical protein